MYVSTDRWATITNVVSLPCVLCLCKRRPSFQGEAARVLQACRTQGQPFLNPDFQRFSGFHSADASSIQDRIVHSRLIDLRISMLARPPARTILTVVPTLISIGLSTSRAVAQTELRQRFFPVQPYQSYLNVTRRERAHSTRTKGWTE